MRHPYPWQLYIQESPPDYRSLGPWRLAANSVPPPHPGETVILLYGEQEQCAAVQEYLETSLLHHDPDIADARLRTLLRVLGREDLVPEEYR